MHVRSVWEGRNKRNPNLEPYSSTDDQRLTFLTTDLPTYLGEWQNGVNKRPGMLSKANRASMLLSHQTVKGINISCASISECVQQLLQIFRSDLRTGGRSISRFSLFLGAFHHIRQTIPENRKQ